MEAKCCADKPMLEVYGYEGCADCYDKWCEGELIAYEDLRRAEFANSWVIGGGYASDADLAYEQFA
jgi:hypothetical protein